MKQFESDNKPKKGKGLGSIFNAIWQNKELIGNVAKGVGAVGTATAGISQAVKSKNELDKIREIKEIREARKRAKK